MIKFRELLPLYAVIFLGFLGYALTITVFIPMLMDRHFLLLPLETSVSVRATLSGLLLAAYPLGQFLGSPIIGNLSDHFGRKKVLLLSLSGCFLGFAGIGASILFCHVVLLFLSSFLTGLFESNMAISQTVITDRTQDGAERARLIGYAYSACSLGYIVGPLLGGSSGVLLGYAAPFFITSGGVLCVLAWLFFGLSDHYVPAATVKSIQWAESLMAVKSIFNKSKFLKIYMINFLIFFSVQGLYRVVPLYVVDEWNPPLQTYSLLIAFVSLLCFLSNLFVLGKLSQRFSSQKLLVGLLFLGGFSVLLIIVPQYFNSIWFTFGLAVIPTVMALPVCTSWLVEQAQPSEQGQVLGNNQALLVLGEATSAAIGGCIAALWIPLPILLTGFLLMFTGVMIWRS